MYICAVAGADGLCGTCGFLEGKDEGGKRLEHTQERTQEQVEGATMAAKATLVRTAVMYVCDSIIPMFVIHNQKETRLLDIFNTAP